MKDEFNNHMEFSGGGRRHLYYRLVRKKTENDGLCYQIKRYFLYDSVDDGELQSDTFYETAEWDNHFSGEL